MVRGDIVAWTAEQRRQRIHELAEQDTQYRQMQAEYHAGKAWFDWITGFLPRNLRNRFWQYPGTEYFMHHRILTIICNHMKFIDEDESRHL